MDSEEYFDRVIRFFETNGWNTSSSQVNTETYLVTGTRKSDTYYDRMLTIVVVAELTKLSADHVEYLLEAASEHDVDRAMATCRAGMTEDAESLVADNDVEFVETTTIDDAFVDNFSVDEDDSGLGNAVSRESGESSNLVVTLDGGTLQWLLGLYALVTVGTGIAVAALAIATDPADTVAATIPAAVVVVAPALAIATGGGLGASEDRSPVGALFAGTLVGYLALAFVLGVVVAALGETGASVVYATPLALVVTTGLGILFGGLSVAAGTVSRRLLPGAGEE